MKINPAGLPTPWPIALISAGIAFLGILIGYSTADKEKKTDEEQPRTQGEENNYELDSIGSKQGEEEIAQSNQLNSPLSQLKINPLSAFSSTITATRCSLALFGSWLSFGLFGLTGFQYAELSWLASLAAVIYFVTFRRKLTKIMKSMWGVIGKMWKKGIIINCCLEQAERERKGGECCGLLFGLALQLAITAIPLIINIALTFNIISPPLSYLWNIVSLAMHANRFNFAKTAQFVANCQKSPQTSWHTIAQCSKQNNTCFIGSRDIWIIDLFIRTLGIVLPFICLVPLLERKWGKKFWRKNQNNENKPWSEVIKEVSIASSAIILAVTGFYVIAMASVQAKGLDTTGLEVCDMNNTAILSSKTGYLDEWINQEWTALKQLALV